MRGTAGASWYARRPARSRRAGALAASLATAACAVAAVGVPAAGARAATAAVTASSLPGGSALWTWGLHYPGDGTEYSRLPVSAPLPTGASITAVDTGFGDYTGLALTTDGTVLGWGLTYPGSNDGITEQPTPAPVPGVSDMVAIGAGHMMHAAIRSDGTLWTWGPGHRTPAPVPGLDHVSAVSVGFQHVLVLRSDGTVWAWGENGDGQLGIGTTEGPVAEPVRVPGLTDIVAVAADWWDSYAVDDDGTVWSWGWNGHGQLGRDTATTFGESSPGRVQGVTDAVAVAAGRSSAVALLADGTLRTWGDGEDGEAGDGTSGYSERYRPVPVAVPGITDAVAVSADDGLLALLADGTVRGWGHYEGGDDPSTRTTVPTRLPGLAGVVAITGGEADGSAALTVPAGTGSDLHVGVAVSAPSVTADRSVTYTATVTNDGPSAHPDPVVELLSGGRYGVYGTYHQLDGVHASQGGCTVTGLDAQCRLGPLPAGASATVTLVLTPIAPGQMPFAARLPATYPEPWGGDNLARVVTTSVPAPHTRYVYNLEEYWGPGDVTVAQGDTVQFDDIAGGVIADHTGMHLFSLPQSPAGYGTHVYTAAGTYTVQGSGWEDLIVRVPVQVTRSPWPGSTSYRVHVATRRPSAGFAYDVQIRRPGGTFVRWHRGLGAAFAMFTPPAPGTYAFRSRLRRVATGAASGWSPAASVTRR